MHDELLSEIRNIEVIAEEIHWYEAHGIGRKGFKIIRLFPEG